MNGTSAEATSRGHPRRKWLRRMAAALATAACGVITLGVAAPYLVSGPFRDHLVSRLFARVNGRVTVGKASLGWFSPATLENIAIRSPDGEKVIGIEAVRGHRTLGSVIVHPRDLGQYTIERPRLHLTVTPQGSNLAALFPRPVRLTPDAEPPPVQRRYPALPDISGTLRVVDAGLTYRGPESTEPWSVEKVNLTLTLLRATQSPSGHPEIVVEPSQVFDHAAITRPMCKDLLQYIAPALAGTTRISGEVSLHLDAWHIVYGDIPQSTGRGALRLHRLDMGPAALFAALAQWVEIPEDLRLVDDSAIVFELREGRVYHENAALGAGDFRVSTFGSVGLADRSLDLVARVPVPAALFRDRPLGTALAGQTLEIRVGGTLDQPQVDKHALREQLLTLAATAAQRLLHQGEDLPPETRERMAKEGVAGLIDAGVPLGAALLERLQAERAAEPGDSAGPVRAFLDVLRRPAVEEKDRPTSSSSSPPASSPSTPPGRRILQRLRDHLAPAPEP